MCLLHFLPRAKDGAGEATHAVRWCCACEVVLVRLWADCTKETVQDGGSGEFSWAKPRIKSSPERRSKSSLEAKGLLKVDSHSMSGAGSAVEQICSYMFITSKYEKQTIYLK